MSDLQTENAELRAKLAAAEAEAERSTKRLAELSEPGSIGAFARRDHALEQVATLTRQLDEARAANAAMREQWQIIAGFAVCESDPAANRYRVIIDYQSLPQAQAAYSAMAQITKLLNAPNPGQPLLDELERLRGEVAERDETIRLMKRDMDIVANYVKPNWSNDMEWCDEIIIAIDNRVNHAFETVQSCYADRNPEANKANVAVARAIAAEDAAKDETIRRLRRLVESQIASGFVSKDDDRWWGVWRVGDGKWRAAVDMFEPPYADFDSPEAAVAWIESQSTEADDE